MISENELETMLEKLEEANEMIRDLLIMFPRDIREDERRAIRNKRFDLQDYIIKVRARLAERGES